MTRILITGSEGFIGSHVVEALVRGGHTVRAHVLYNSFNSWGWLEHLPQDVRAELDVFVGDVRDASRTREAVRGTSVIVHLASLIAIPYSYVAAQSYMETNVIGLVNLLEAARELAIERFVHTSTSEVYGTAQFVPMTELHPTVAQSPYAASKAAADQVAGSYHRSFDVPVVTLRPFNVYGPRQSARAFIPAVLTQLAAGREALDLGDLEPTRDLTFVEDTAAAFARAVDAPGIVGETINIGSGFEISMRNIVERLMRVTGRSAAIHTNPERVRPAKSEVQRLFSDSGKANRLLGWTPRTPLDDGLAATARWFMDSANMAAYKPHVHTL